MRLLFSASPPSGLSYGMKKHVKKSTSLGLVAVLIATIFLPLFGFILPANQVQAAWWNEDWRYRQVLTIDGSQIDTNLTDFPILISLTSSQLDFAKAQSQGQDIRFTDQQGNQLAYEIVSWDQGGQIAEVWVKVPMVHDTGTTLYLYYGNPSATDTQYPQAVWSNGYSHVYHLNNSAKNSANGNTTAGFGPNGVDAAGKIGKARSKQSPYANILWNTTEDRPSAGQLNVEAWFKPDGFRDWDNVAGQGWIGNGWVLYTSANGRPSFGVASGGVQANTTGASSLVDGQWNYLTGNYTGTVSTLYVDGVAVGTPQNVVGYATDVSSDIYNIATNQQGAVDELRISYLARSAAWIKASHASGNNTLVSFSSEQSSVGPIAYWKFDEGYSTTIRSSTAGSANGTMYGPEWQDESNCVGGKCLDFDRSQTDRAFINAPTELNKLTNTLTISAWVYYRGDAAGDAQQIAIAQNVANSIRFGTRNPATISSFGFYCGNCSTSKWYDDARSIPRNTWHNLTTTADGSTIRLYQNGVLTLTDTYSGNIVANSGDWNIGALGNDTYNWNGRLDEIKVYGYARTQQQIQQDYTVGAQQLSAQQANLSNGLIGHWKMDEASWNGTPGEIKDLSGSGYNATAIAGAAVATGKFGNGGSYDGIDDYISTSGGISLPLSGTMSAWIKPHTDMTAPSNYPSLTRYSSDVGVHIQQTTGRPYIQVLISGVNQTCIASQSLIANTWQLITATYQVIDGNTLLKIYSNEQQLCSSLKTGIITPPTVSVLMGSLYKGLMDETRYYNRALSVNEVAQLYNYAPKPVGYWDFEEGSGGTVNDRSGNGNTGTWNGTGSPHYAAGKYGWAGNFDGSTDFVNISNASPFNNLGTGDFTIGAWVWQNNTSGMTVVSNGACGNNCAGWELSFTNNNVLVWRIGNASGSPVQGSGPSGIGNNKWNHIVLSRANGALNIYANGVLNATDTTPGVDLSVSNSDLLRIGNGVWGEMAGKIDEVKVYNYARTPQQILQDMQASMSGKQQSVGHWRFDEGQGTIANNSGVGGTTLNGTLTNMASPPTSTSGWTTDGKLNSALGFDGNDDFVQVADNYSLDIGTEDKTWSAWFKTTSTSRVGIYRKSVSSNAHGMIIDLGLAVPGQVRCMATDGSLVSIDVRSTNSVWNDGQWHQMTCSLNRARSSIALYLDGKLNNVAVNSSFSKTNLDANAVAYIGQHASAAFFDGQIDEVKVFQGALTAQDVAVEYNLSAGQKAGAISTTPTIAQSGNPASKPSTSAGSTYCVPGSPDPCAKPVGEWNFEEGSASTLRDISGNNINGTLVNNPQWTNGKSGKALDFNGSNSYVNLLDNLDMTGTDMSLSVWIKPRSLTAYAGIVNKLQSGGNYRLIAGHSQANTISFGIRDSGGGYEQLATQSTIPLNQWTHIQVTMAGNQAKIFVNGRLDNQATMTLTRGDTADSLTIGRNGNNNVYFDGVIDQVRIYNYARTPAQVAWDYNYGKPLAQYKMDECQGSRINDSSGNNLFGALNLGVSGVTTIGTCSSTGSAWSNGKLGRFNASMSFDGVDDQIDIASTSIMNPSAFTIATWINPADRNDFRSIYYRNGDPYCALQNATGRPYCYLTTEIPRAVAIANPTVPVGQWSQVIYTFQSGGSGNNSTFKIYINGQQVASDTTSFQGNIVHNTNSSRIGSFGVSSGPMKGQIDDYQIFNYALTTEQIKVLYNNGSMRWGP